MISAYVHEFDRFADRSLDFVLIDGMYRGHCAIRAMSKVKPGGLIVIDNAIGFFRALRIHRLRAPRTSRLSMRLGRSSQISLAIGVAC